MARPVTPQPPVQLEEFGPPRDYPAALIDMRTVSAANQQWMRALRLSTEPLEAEDLGNGFIRLRARGVTGVIRIGKVDVEIAPKFLNSASGSWQTVLWRILSVVEGGIVDENLTSANHVVVEGLPDLLAEMFLSSYAKGAGRGLPRGYVAHASSGSVLRGALDTTKFAEWLGLPWTVPYVTDLLTEDTPLGRLLRWSADLLASTVRSAGRARALREVVSSLSEVGHLPPRLFDAQRIKLGAQHRGLEPAVLVGLLLLEGGGIHHERGGQSLSGFLWNSDVIYENFVFWICSRAAKRAGLQVRKSTLQFGTVVSGLGKPFQTTPDVVFSDPSRAGAAVAVLDAKYKALGLRPKAGDTYQVLTAAHVLGCRRVSLTYPGPGNAERLVWQVDSQLGADSIEISAIPLNLMALVEKHGLKTTIGTVGDWLQADSKSRSLVT
jgi:hypothetical protein